jgi:hypothetical protein
MSIADRVMLSLVIAFPTLMIWSAIWLTFAAPGSGGPVFWITMHLRQLPVLIGKPWFWFDYFATAVPIFFIDSFVRLKGWRWLAARRR